MSAPKFTPGPWSLEAGRSIVTPSGRFYLGYGSHPKSGNPEFRNFVELDNNAHLCAAAPEMYAALEASVSALEDARELVLARLEECSEYSGASSDLSEQDTGLDALLRSVETSLESARSALGKAGGE